MFRDEWKIFVKELFVAKFEGIQETRWRRASNSLCTPLLLLELFIFWYVLLVYFLFDFILIYSAHSNSCCSAVFC